MSARPTRVRLPKQKCPKCHRPGIIKTNQPDGHTVEFSCPRRGCGWVVEKGGSHYPPNGHQAKGE